MVFLIMLWFDNGTYNLVNSNEIFLAIQKKINGAMMMYCQKVLGLLKECVQALKSRVRRAIASAPIRPTVEMAEAAAPHAIMPSPSP